jgi:hypothetical protein
MSASSTLGLDSAGKICLIFGAFMAAGVAGGLFSSYFRRGMTLLLSPLIKKKLEAVTNVGEEVRPIAVELLASFLLSPLRSTTPCTLCIMEEGIAVSFSTLLGALSCPAKDSSDPSIYHRMNGLHHWTHVCLSNGTEIYTIPHIMLSPFLCLNLGILFDTVLHTK